jgi:hypothetical protein
MPHQNQTLAESYLIRLWRDREHGPWRASLQHIRSGEAQHFACPEELWTYLQLEMAGECHQPETSGQHQRQ